MISTVMTVNQLKQSCTVAPAKARSNCSVSVTWVSETSVLVKLVPTLAPITIGIAVLTFKTTEVSVRLYFDLIVPKSLLTSTRDQRDNYRGASRGTLHQNSEQNSNHQAHNWIAK